MAAPQYQSPVAPAIARQKSPVKIILIGCGALIALAIVAAVAVYLFSDKIKDVAETAKTEITETTETLSEAAGMDEATAQTLASMKQTKQAYMKMLSRKHTKAKKKRFEKTFDAVYIEELERLGMIKWGMAYQGEVQKLSKTLMDGKITTRESRDWIRSAEKALKKNGYTKK